MRVIDKRLSGERTPAGCTALLMLLLLLAGCASGGKKVKQEPVEQAPTLVEGPAVTRLQDGREGFVIRETPSLDAESRRDFDRAVAMMKERKFEEAVELLEKVIESTPEVTAPYINIAMAYAAIDRLEPAEQHLKTALRLVPEHPAASNEYGLLLRKSGRFAEAREIYEKALARFPEYLPARRNLGILCDLYLNDPACALEQYEIFSEAASEDEQMKLWIADLRMRLGGGG
jgi:tetratricopeptide (TPR) repeat protein